DLIARGAAGDEGSSNQGEIFALTSSLRQAFAQVGQDSLLDVLGRVKAVDVEPFAQLPSELSDQRVQARDENRNLGMRDRPRVKEGGHEGELVEFAEVVQLSVVLPAVPDRPQRQDHLTQPLDRRHPFNAKAALVVTFDLGSQTENEATFGVSL